MYDDDDDDDDRDGGCRVLCPIRKEEDDRLCDFNILLFPQLVRNNAIWMIS
jgi:hypothetical protein